jgi:hypothetical protein
MGCWYKTLYQVEPVSVNQYHHDSRHLRSTGHHDSFGKLKVTIIDHNPKWDDKSRQERESFWIRKLKTLSPNGINEIK